MIKQAFCLLAGLFFAQYLQAQAAKVETETWNEKPVIYKLDSKYNKESAVVVLDKRRVEYVDEAKDEIAEYYTLHKIIHINDDRGIESFNKNIPRRK